jgi:hypothetical protein
MKSRVTVFLLLFPIFFFAMRGETITHLYTNVGTSFLNRGMWKNYHTLTNRQIDFHVAAILFGKAAKVNLGYQKEVKQQAPKCLSTVFALVSAEYHRRYGNFDKAAEFLYCAANADFAEKLENPLIIPLWVDLKPNGTMTIPANTLDWYVRRDTVPSAKIIHGENQLVTLSVIKESNQHHRVAFVWRQSLQISYHHTLILKTRVQKGCQLIIETVTDEEGIVRHLIHTGDGQWQNHVVRLKGNSLRFLYVLLEHEIESGNEECSVELDSLSFLLDEDTDSNGNN